MPDNKYPFLTCNISNICTATHHNPVELFQILTTDKCIIAWFLNIWELYILVNGTCNSSHITSLPVPQHPADLYVEPLSHHSWHFTQITTFYLDSGICLMKGAFPCMRPGIPSLPVLITFQHRDPVEFSASSIHRSLTSIRQFTMDSIYA